MKILLVITNVSKTPKSGLETGFHFAEFSHAYEFFLAHGYEVTIGSPLGGSCTITSDYPGDKINAEFKENPKRMELLSHTTALNRLIDEAFDAVYVAGGHGAMFDLANNIELEGIINTTAERGGVIASVCHGPASLIGLKDRTGNYFVKGKHLTSFTNDEEKGTPFFNDMPFLLQSKLEEQGALFGKSEKRQPRLVIDGNLITGQNPESIELVVGAIYTKLSAK
ncbi:MAG TPA: type 1 glutamine amidotransferase domain-containing protein [Candidatus Saccharimonadales bacterium]|nr:type 1 glutamine amidotransferase domain-containing protein [Candidatus Saccharimonadales bacterium]